ncbi:Asp-tRNA(Asn)/Glu-tRNA(Gln) amidotransferase subunit GatB [bacterium]|nr:Asp-tRNA(Asn)/Glu-tRNA(Gln) amidotransferase subunit GatB [bacterium]
MAIDVTTGWETVIGLEVHAQITTDTKMYCSCPSVNSTELTEANRYVCPVCLGHPGTLPRPNRQAVVRALTLALKLGSQINERSVFARKNYFYPDLPKGYQISQYDLPLAEGGELPYWHNNAKHTARLVRIHLEEDTARLFHLDDGTAVLDYNRGGVPLIEIVSQPDFHDPAECVAYLDELRGLLQRLRVSEAAMESGNMRCEPNISVRPRGSTELRTKTEIKNLNSFATLRRAVEAEAQRQIELYESGQTVHQATMRYDEARGITVPMRVKETADDYRYFDDPDIPPLVITKRLLDSAGEDVRASIFELRQMMAEEDGISHEMAATIADDRILHRFYRLCCKDGHDNREVAKWVTGELVRLLREKPLRTEPGELSKVLGKLKSNELTLPQARDVFETIYLTGKTCEAVVQEKQYSGADAIPLEQVCREVIAANPQIVADIQAGKTNAVQVLVGAVMKKTRGGADPQSTRQLLLRLLNAG